MFRENTTMIKADVRKGLVYMYQADDSLMHFCWKDRSSGTVEDDLIVFPDEAELIRIPQCTTGRAYVLKFKTSSQRLFFWLQDLSDKEDDKAVLLINKLLKDPAHAATLRTASGGGSDQAMLDLASGGSEEQRQLMQILQQQGLLGALSPQVPPATAAPSGNGASVSLSSLLTVELVEPVLRDQAMSQQLFPLLPPGHSHTTAEIRTLIRSPQFQQAVDGLNQAIESGQHGALLAELGMRSTKNNSFIYFQQS